MPSDAMSAGSARAERPKALAELALPRWARIDWQHPRPSAGGSYRDDARPRSERATIVLRWRGGWQSLIVGPLCVGMGLVASGIWIGWVFVVVGGVVTALAPYRLVQRTNLTATCRGLERTFSPLPPHRSRFLEWSQIQQVKVRVERLEDGASYAVLLKLRDGTSLRLIGQVSRQWEAEAIAAAVRRLAEHFRGD